LIKTENKTKAEVEKLKDKHEADLEELKQVDDRIRQRILNMSAYEEYLISVMERNDNYTDKELIQSRYNVLTFEHRNLERKKGNLDDCIEQERGDM
jgi:hypothetical protein